MYIQWLTFCQQQPIDAAERSDDLRHGPQRLIVRILGLGTPKRRPLHATAAR